MFVLCLYFLMLEVKEVPFAARTHQTAARSEYPAALDEALGSWYRKSHPPSSEPLRPGKSTHPTPPVSRYVRYFTHTGSASCYVGRVGALTSTDCRMVWRGIQAVPTMVSQMRPLFHTSTMRPRSSRLISLRSRKIGT